MLEPTLTLAYALIAVGFLLLAGELFLPTGVLAVLAAAAFLVGVAIVFYRDATLGWLTTVGLVVVLPVLLWLVSHYGSRSALGRRFFLQTPAADDTVASMPLHKELEELVGRYGRAVGALRPAGMVDFDGRRVDTLTEGMMVEPGQWVRCVEVKAGKVVVRPMDKPDLSDLENMDLR